MEFAFVAAFQPWEQIVPLAQACEEAGFRALSLADHVVDHENLSAAYPYTEDQRRRWQPGTDWPDPWVLIGALGQATTRLEFFTSVYVAALRSPFVVAKAVGTAAALTGGRVRLGVGVGWNAEEFDLLEADFRTRGRRTDEALALMAELWSPGWTTFEGEFYSCESLVMKPQPPGPVPIWVGGLSDVALRRAARHDGWVGDMATVDEGIALAGQLRSLREEAGRGDKPFEVVPALIDAITPGDFERAAAGGVTMTMTVPWMYYHPADASLEQKLDGIGRFGEDVIAKL
ncbi:TIGR03619 family F420-dependent LLM class oxidoreductase [Nocardioides sp. Kera G14]|uniref:TIGR03619 family F420-dependent LLM class oxidoreductase n=1 Tax=Nocardioides sp. Kera G14 TaxID=2884264 RepID=UPI001D117327|nr:TIGR03619 family F420-dependent LLM class oxidoreductase [Nocardioides sp. Kera G14]UDY24998.1 TIGR03619 family F420-dependent LLM class oxidoreductase [Nocardioides sp. Kera G14]